VSRESRCDKFVKRLLRLETAGLHPLLDSVRFLGLPAVRAARALVVNVIPLTEPEIHATRRTRALRNFQSPLAHEHVDKTSFCRPGGNRCILSFPRS
jgi:hypothetical protein